MFEALEQFVSVELELGQTLIQVEQVAVLSSLKQRSQFGREYLFRLIGDDLRLTLIPAAFHREGIMLESKKTLVFARIDLNFQL